MPHVATFKSILLAKDCIAWYLKDSQVLSSQKQSHGGRRNQSITFRSHRLAILKLSFSQEILFALLLLIGASPVSRSCRTLTIGSSRSLRSLGTAFRGPLTKR